MQFPFRGLPTVIIGRFYHSPNAQVLPQDHQPFRLTAAAPEGRNARPGVIRRVHKLFQLPAGLPLPHGAEAAALPLSDGFQPYAVFLADGVERLTGIDALQEVYLSGTRAEDMALRFLYAGFPKEKLHVQKDSGKLMEEATAHKLPVFVMPTYTAMLALRGTISKTYGYKQFWE